MFFIVLTFLTAFLIEGLGTLVSVIGLSALFGSNPIIIALAIALDLGKIVVVSFLYTYWKQSGKIMKAYALCAAIVTMTITSAGASGYLSGEFQKAIMGTQESTLKVDVLKQQQAKYEERKRQIDEQIAKLPEKTTVSNRLRLMNAFKAEQQELQAKIAQIDKDLPELQIKQIGVEAKAGPIIYISKAFNIPIEEAVKYVILMIIFVFDPLAVFLIIAGNFLLHQRKINKGTKVSDADLFAEPDDDIRTGPLEMMTRPRENGEDLIHPTVEVDRSGEKFEPIELPEETQPIDWDRPPEKEVIPEVVVPERHVSVLTDDFKIEEGDSLPPAPEEVTTEHIDLPIEEPQEPIFEKLEPTSADTTPFVFREEPVFEPQPLIDLQPEPVVETPVKPREKVTLSTLGLVRADPDTIVDASADNLEEVGFRTGVYKSNGARSK